MGNRPINRRPWRKKPWGKKRPTRWNSSTNGATDGLALNTTVLPGGLTPGGEPPLAIIADGQIDVEPWADEQEVTIDRIVGSVCFTGYSRSASISFNPRNVLLKMGIVLNEELSGDGSLVTRNLWDQEDLEDTEWMWLKCFAVEPKAYSGDYVNGTGYFHYATTVDIDLRNRRKIGQKDELALYASYVVTASDYEVQLLSYTDLRCILMSR